MRFIGAATFLAFLAFLAFGCGDGEATDMDEGPETVEVEAGPGWPVFPVAPPERFDGYGFVGGFTDDLGGGNCVWLRDVDDHAKRIACLQDPNKIGLDGLSGDGWVVGRVDWMLMPTGIPIVAVSAVWGFDRSSWVPGFRYPR